MELKPFVSGTILIAALALLAGCGGATVPAGSPSGYLPMAGHRLKSPKPDRLPIPRRKPPKPFGDS